MAGINWTTVITTAIAPISALVGVWGSSLITGRIKRVEMDAELKKQSAQLLHEREMDAAKRLDDRAITAASNERNAIVAALELPLDQLALRQLTKPDDANAALFRLRSLARLIDDIELLVIVEQHARLWEVQHRLAYILRTERNLRTPDGHLEPVNRAREEMALREGFPGRSSHDEGEATEP